MKPKQNETKDKTLAVLVSKVQAGQSLAPMQRKILIKQSHHLSRHPSPLKILTREWKQRTQSQLAAIFIKAANQYLLPGGSIRTILEQSITKILPKAVIAQVIACLPATAAQTCQLFNTTDCQNWVKQFSNLTASSTLEDCFSACSELCQNFNFGLVKGCSEIVYSCLHAGDEEKCETPINWLINPWVIAAAVAVLLMVGLGAYHCGKRSAVSRQNYMPVARHDHEGETELTASVSHSS